MTRWARRRTGTRPGPAAATSHGEASSCRSPPLTAYQPVATNGPPVMTWIFAKLPRPMQRTFRDDLKWSSAYLVGLVVGYLAFGHGHVGLLIGGLIGVTISIVA